MLALAVAFCSALVRGRRAPPPPPQHQTALVGGGAQSYAVDMQKVPRAPCLGYLGDPVGDSELREGLNWIGHQVPTEVVRSSVTSAGSRYWRGVVWPKAPQRRKYNVWMCAQDLRVLRLQLLSTFWSSQTLRGPPSGFCFGTIFEALLL